MPDTLALLPPEIIRAKRDGQALDRARIDAFVKGLADGSWNDAQCGAMAMALYQRGLDDRETTDLTDAMMRSGTVLDWKGKFDGPVVDKHSTGGVGDKVSLALAPILAVCGGVVPMISGRGLGHTGGTLDKLEAIPGYRTQLSREALEAVLRETGCAIVGASSEVAPADRRLYAIRDVTATVDSIPLICASILSKKLAAGLEAMVLDVKVGNGAFARDEAFARALASTLSRVAHAAGLANAAWITDMNQVLGRTCGNAVEVAEALAYLRGEAVDARLTLVTEALCAELLVMGRLAPGIDAATARVRTAVQSGDALERFARMVAAQGGPKDFVEHPGRYLPVAPAQLAFRAASAGWVQRVATRELGLAVIELGGGRRGAGNAIDPRVGFTQVAAPGDRVATGDVLAVVHAANDADARAALARLAAIIQVGDTKPAEQPVLRARVSVKGDA